MQIRTFEEAWTSTSTSTRHLIYGNGLTVGLDARFSFQELLGPTLTNMSDPLAQRLEEAPDVLDIETAVLKLRTPDPEEFTVEASDAPSEIGRTVREAIAFDRSLDAEVWRALGLALLEPHEDISDAVPTEKAKKAATFLSRFDKTFTLNLDLLWLWLQEEHPNLAPATGPTHVHGGLHLIANQPLGLRQGAAGSVEIDNVAEPGNYDRTLREVRASIKGGRFPALVLADRHTRKQKLIEWLDGALGRQPVFHQLGALDGTLFTFGWRATLTDRHLLDAVAKAPELDAICYGVFEPTEEKIRQEKAELQRVQEARAAHNLDGLDISLYDTTEILTG